MSSFSKDYTEDDIINITTRNKERYKCIVPSDREQLDFTSSAKNSSSDAEGAQTPMRYLYPLLKGNLCSLKFEMFWVYELCHGKFLRQFHEESGKQKKLTQDYYLGVMDEDQLKAHEEEYKSQSAELEKSGDSRPKIMIDGHYRPYVQYNMTDGTKCDLTKKPRVARVLYVCNGDDRKHELYSIKEVSTCEYEAIVITSLLCKHKDFKVDTNAPSDIECYSIGDAPKDPMKETHDDENDVEDEPTGDTRKQSIAFFRGKTLIIDSTLL